MKKWIFLLACLCLLGLCTACGNTKEPTGEWSITEESNRQFTDSLSLRITEMDVSQNSVTYEIDNSSKDTYCCGTGADFSLEVLHKGVWHKMDHEPGWAITLELLILNPGETKELSTGLMGDLPAGTYRFVKQIALEGASGDKEFICCEFVME